MDADVAPFRANPFYINKTFAIKNIINKIHILTKTKRLNMNFRTEIKIADNPVKIEHSQKIVTIGSCFAENIAGQFKFYIFDVFENPFGVLYNPVSIYNALKITFEQKQFSKDDLILNQGEWHSFYHHSDFSSHNADDCLCAINTRTKEVKEYLAHAEWIIISLGTSYIYRHIERNLIVSNCHKINANQFERILLPPEETVKYLNKLVGFLRKINPDIKIILTVSPIRHIKDGFAENQLSKSSLIVSVREAIKKNDNCFYFPSYEIMIDDLRDYRFYEKDMLHPNKIAIEYIWEKFTEAYLSKVCIETIKEIEPYAKGLLHRPKDANSPQSKLFLESLGRLKEDLKVRFPHLNI